MGVVKLDSHEQEEKPLKDTIQEQVVKKESSSDKIKEKIENIEEQKEKEEEQPKTVVLSGPLSHVYTQALNMVYAKESSMTDGSLLLLEDDKEVMPDLYVYCTDTDELDNNIVTPTNQINVALDKKDASVIVAVESSKRVTERGVMLEDYVVSRGGRVCLTRKSALEAIRTAIEGLKKRG